MNFLRQIFWPHKKKKRTIKKINNSTIKVLEQEIIRKEQLIQSLNEKNDLLLKTTMRQSNTITDLKLKIAELNDRVSKRK